MDIQYIIIYPVRNRKKKHKYYKYYDVTSVD